LAREAGEAEPRLATLTTTSLPALQAYLAGKLAVRNGRLREATDAFDRALQLDSTFALAAMDLAWWAVWVEQGERMRRARVLAWQYRDRLNARDQILLVPRLFGDYPSVTGGAHSQRAVLRDWEQAVAAAPDRPEEWFGYGNALFLFGHILGLQAPAERAAAAYRRALDLDSTFALAVYRLGDLAVFAGDSTGARRLLGRYVTLDSVSEQVDALRWRVAARFGDSAERAVMRARLSAMSRASLHRILGNAQLDGTGLDDAERVAALLRSGAGTRSEQRNTMLRLHNFELNRGRPRAALALARALGDVESVPGADLVVRVADALFWGGDSIGAASAARDLAALRDASAAAPDDRAWTGATCAVALWALANGDRGTASRVLTDLRAVTGTASSREAVALRERCEPLVAAELAAAEGEEAAAAALSRLDSVASLGGPGAFAHTQSWQRFLNLVAARRHEARGDLVGALAAVRRHASFDPNQGGTFYLSTYLREEGRLAALNGERSAAIRAYRHYLALRADPEPSLRFEVAQVRGELTRLMRGYGN
jgi:Tfp pilus assembly protein PilF